MRRFLVPFLLPVLVFFAAHAFAQPDPSAYGSLRWRMIGPHRGGRTVGAVGIPQQPNVFYIGVNNGGVWKTTDYGRTWMPIFDDQPTGSIGDIVVAPSNPNVIYVGSGEGLQRPDLSVGNGLYKSTDAGRTWSHQGLADGQQVGGLAIDPKNENRVFAAVLGHPYGPNTERGVYRTTDGGLTWQRVLYKDENTGAIQVAIDPVNPDIVYASMWAGRQGPWENGAWNGPESGLFKSTDGGSTWTKLSGLPTPQQGLGRIGFCIAPSDPKRLYATVDASPQYGGIYRSDDAGATWRRMTGDNRFYGRASDFAEVKADPVNPDIVYSANVVTWKSVDGGKTWSAFRGAPGGDDYHRIWINPLDPKIILIASDQGAIITVNGGETFSSWYNQPTAQFYHVNTDNAFPYNVYGGQQESGSVGIASRGNDGQISYREWHPVGVEEYGYVAPDPRDPDIIYGGKITRYNKRTGQVQNIAPEIGRGGQYRFLRTAPVLFSPADQKTLFYAGNVLFKTTTGGEKWDVISPDLSRESWDIPASVGIYASEEMKKMPRRGVIYTVAPSPSDINTIWCGTDDGLIHLTTNGGKTWTNVTPPSITSWSKVSLLEAGHFDAKTAYAAVNRIRLDDMKPHIYKTHDGGRTWREIVTGLPADPVNVVREDPVRKGLLYAGTERAVYVSADDGAHWSSLRQNMPATSIRDLVVKDNDLVVGTHGRSFWILDDISPLRQWDDGSPSQARLFRPADTYRVRWSIYTDTPVPQEEPAGENPPDGAILYYNLPAAARDVSLEVRDSKGLLVRRYTSADRASVLPPSNVPEYWVRPFQPLGATAGSHRFVWDLRYQPLDLQAGFPMGAVYRNTATSPTSPLVSPGMYKVSLTVDGKTVTQPLMVRPDPRVKQSAAGMQLISDLSRQAYEHRRALLALSAQVTELRNRITAASQAPGDTTLLQVQRTLQQFESAPTGTPSLNRSLSLAASLFDVIDESDWTPTRQMSNGVQKLGSDLALLTTRWAALKSAAEKALGGKSR
ncbi:MAG: glycoside hydrolase [Flaviaesturariibacter sp.]|nr:glycoside hydrolase [Flaviaesturariibacter sp.]